MLGHHRDPPAKLSAMTTLNPQERLDWLRLIRSDHVGPVTFYHMVRHFGSAAAALEALPSLARRGGRPDARICSRAEAERELAEIARAGAALVAWGEPDYPPLLAETEDAPPLLTVLGKSELLQRRAVAVVGARNASAAGMRFAREIAWDLGRHGLLVVSGLARGIDGAAHGGALDSGTAAVVAGGADVVYPEENRELQQEIAEHGVIIAEPRFGTVPQARHFPRRNRLISGLSLGVLVVEAALKSGSLITARLAADQGREVFAVPGFPLDPRHRGTNDLIRNGATLVETIEDVLGVIGETAPRPGLAEDRRRRFAPVSDSPDESEVGAAHTRIVELLGPTAVPLDDLARSAGLPLPLINMVLVELELAGRLERHAGNRVALR
ncbi:MAG TPA: DNA-processing protein DprA [Stellaceae bacterium]|nr:DNA-processing protein DprA [Stellaceae bacterium]